MNHLEEYIRSHKSLFDEEPAAGHFERLAQKMNRENAATHPTGSRQSRKESSGRLILRWSVAFAASIAILLSAGLIWQNAMKPNGTLVCEKTADMKICYLDKMNVIADHIEKLISEFDQWDRHDIMTEVQNIIDSADSDFESELPEELPDNLAKAILSDFYQQNLEGLIMIEQRIINM